MFSHKTTKLVTAVFMILSSVTQAQIANPSDSKARDEGQAETASDTSKNDELMANMVSLLAKSTELRIQYAETEKVVEALQESVKVAKEKCEEVCDLRAVSDVLLGMNALSTLTVLTGHSLNAVRGVYGYLSKNRYLAERAIRTWRRPLDTKTGIGLVVGHTIIGLGFIAQAFLEGQQTYTKDELAKLEVQLAAAKEDLKITGVNQEVTNRSIQQTIRLLRATANKN
jgi:hypothetical protein